MRAPGDCLPWWWGVKTLGNGVKELQQGGQRLSCSPDRVVGGDARLLGTVGLGGSWLHLERRPVAE